MSRKIIIPAAGFGRRVGQPESKEMLPRPIGLDEAGQPMIRYALRAAEVTSAEPHVILRREKKNLIDYLDREKVDFQSVSPTQEWPNTLLLSEKYWGEFNVVCLPDSHFEPISIVEDLFSSLEKESEVVFAAFGVSDPRVWGMLYEDREVYEDCEEHEDCEETRQSIFQAEKPNCFYGDEGHRENHHRENNHAWGLFGFRRSVGKRLLEQLAQSTIDHQWRKLDFKIKILKLETFQDLTR